MNKASFASSRRDVLSPVLGRSFELRYSAAILADGGREVSRIHSFDSSIAFAKTQRLK
jgi:hypothetical protein